MHTGPWRTSNRRCCPTKRLIGAHGCVKKEPQRLCAGLWVMTRDPLHLQTFHTSFETIPACRNRGCSFRRCCPTKRLIGAHGCVKKEPQRLCAGLWVMTRDPLHLQTFHTSFETIPACRNRGC